MKTNKKYLILSMATVFAVAAMSLGTISSAQTALTCSVNPASVGINQTATLTATGGTGTYSWSGQNLNVTNSGGNQFAVTYPSLGTYTVTVNSGNQSATCNVNVVSGASTSSLSCLPAVQSVTLGKTIAVSATGGNGTYTWSSPDLTIANPNGSGFSASYASVGLKTLTVTSGGAVATCAINVLPSTTFPTTPGLPNTGGGFGR